ncbi:oxidoreductase [Pseudomonas oryzihabitans]|uniref:SDR family oxidoreductase n=1 Tax=Pseudomonas rhizoryzae TaxID=2571129 RepID=UPI0007371851|nr:SDR family oxidoreductase [Pseudomonas rhizoryzae]KTT28629.1 oxidoreductase [Pseudomonas psychrotolerans]KTT39449.1 oxidoreductase [Pseudomonas psychrotolerans]KTT46414.1 oxidoreductase [Pseudomonas psychrotolerans]KTT62830.1 oxidoreductase [Pseudomonas psychrotolerans]KTT78556.1 oxidoreductase [Pseudomonas psychrotolerans]
MRLDGKRALITAAGQGIGLASARLFAEAGAEVIATDIRLDALYDLPGIEARVLDVTSPTAIEALQASLGSVDILFNCAGYVHSGTILDCDESAWQRSFDLNVTAMYRLIRAFLPAMIERGGGSIINMASVASSVKAVPERLAYTASKAAVIGLTKAIAIDHVRQGIRCNAICPGTVDSPSLQQRIVAAAQAENLPLEDVRARFIARQPMGRFGQAEEIARLALYLASDASLYTTGTVQVIDGGMSL